MADGRQPEGRAPQWSSPSAQGSSSPGGHGENGFSSYRACQLGGAHAGSTTSYSKENGFNGDLTSGHAVTAEQVSARIVQEVTAEAVAVLKGEQEQHPDTAVRLPSVEDSANLPPSPPPSPAAEHFGPLEQVSADGRLPFSVARHSRDRTSNPTTLTKIPCTSKMRAAALVPVRPNSANYKKSPLVDSLLQHLTGCTQHAGSQSLQQAGCSSLVAGIFGTCPAGDLQSCATSRHTLKLCTRSSKAT